MQLKSLAHLISSCSEKRAKIACALVAAASCLGGLSVVAPNSSIGQSAMALLRDPSSILADRSPGARAAGALTQSKPARAISSHTRRANNLGPAGGPPIKRVQAALAPLVGGPALAPGAPVFPPSLDLLPGVPGLASDIYAPGSTGTSGGFAPGFSLPGGGSGGGGGYYELPQPPIVPGVGGPSGVPEPATWVTLLVGFFAIGRALRRPFRTTTSMTCAAGG